MILDPTQTDFNSSLHVVGCFVECEGKILMVHHLAHKSPDKADKWGMPGGKVDPGESSIEAMVRELDEETGIQVGSEELTFIHTLNVRWDLGDIQYDVYRIRLDNMPEVRLSLSEHDDFVWMNPAEIDQYRFIEDVDNCIKLNYVTV